MKRACAILAVPVILALYFLLPGCKVSNDDLSRYASIAVPDYDANRYYLFLFDKNNELVYNGICNLMDEADSMASALSDDKADKSSKKYVLASRVYRRIMELLESKDDRVVSACLRFLQLFGPQYGGKEDLVAPVLKIKGRGQNVRCEQIFTLTAIVSKDSKVGDAFLEASLKDPSWLVSRAAYGLINSLENDRMRSKLMVKYVSTDSEYEKLLILVSMNKGFSSGVFRFLSKEALDTGNKKIRSQIFRSFGNARDIAGVLKWIDANYARLSPDDIDDIKDDRDISDGFAGSLCGIRIKNGWLPDNNFFAKLYEYKLAVASAAGGDLSEEGAGKIASLRRLEDEVLAHKAAADKWKAYVDNKEAIARGISSEIKAEYDSITQQFKEKLNGILDKNGVDPDKKKEFFDALSSAFMDKKAMEKAENLFKLMLP